MAYTLPKRRAFAHPNARLDTQITSGLVCAIRLGRLLGADDVASRQAIGYNLAPNGPHGPAGRLLLGAPTVNDESWTFAANTDQTLTDGLRFGIDEPTTWCGYIVFRTLDSAPAGATGCPGMGWFGGNDGFGSLVFIVSNGGYQLRGYQDSPATVKAVNVGVTNNTVSTWRALYAEFSAAGLGLQNLTAGQAMVSTAFTTAPRPGDRKLTFGSAYNTYSGGNPEIHAARLYSGVTHSDATKAAVLAEMRAAVVGTALANTF